MAGAVICLSLTEDNFCPDISHPKASVVALSVSCTPVWLWMRFRNVCLGCYRDEVHLQVEGTCPWFPRDHTQAAGTDSGTEESPFSCLLGTKAVNSRGCVLQMKNRAEGWPGVEVEYGLSLHAGGPLTTSKDGKIPWGNVQFVIYMPKIQQTTREAWKRATAKSSDCQPRQAFHSNAPNCMIKTKRLDHRQNYKPIKECPEYLMEGGKKTLVINCQEAMDFSNPVAVANHLLWFKKCNPQETDCYCNSMLVFKVH